MPELDRFERSFGAGWRRAFNYARNGDSSINEIGDALVKSLAATLRDRNGIPGMDDLVGIIRGKSDSISIEAFAQLDRIERVHRGHRHTKIGADVAKTMLVAAELDPEGFSGTAIEFAEQICIRLLDHEFFDRARSHLIEVGKLQSHEESHQWQRSVLEHLAPAIKKVAEQLVEDPQCSRLRAPKRTVPIKSTEDLLYEDLAAGAEREFDSGSSR
ncbi:MAG: hypothetical protein F4Y67_07675 [Chloroflexi bacterium]|nr:hypothetical protein [Chloroflexota bacterium]